MIQTAPPNDHMNQMGSADHPRVIALLLLMVILTVLVEVWSTRKRGSDKLESQLVNPFFWLFCLFLIVKSILIVFLIYILPVYIVLAFIKELVGGQNISGASFPAELGDPTLKLAFMICLTDNFAETLRYKEKASFRIHFLQYLSFLPISYYGGMVVAWILARLIALRGGFAPSNLGAAGSLFSLPLFVHNVNLNWVIIVVLILIGGALFHLVIERRRE